MDDLLPHNIIINILSRLPAKSLGRLMSVSKSWFSIISSPDFVQLHHNRSISPHTNHFRILLSSTFSLNTIGYETPACYEDFNDQTVKAIVDHKFPLPDEFIYKHWGSCYGLIYFVSYQECIFLWNPCTKLTRIFPNSSTTTTLLSDHAMSFYGLGYDSSTKNYKMVRVTRKVPGKFTKCEVFSLRNNESWSSVHVQSIDEDLNASEEEKGMFSNGALLWQGNKGSEPTVGSIV